MRKFRLPILLGIFIFYSLSLLAEQLPENLKLFVAKHCYECHDEDVQKGDFDLASLSFNLDDEETLQKWVKVFDQVDKAQMPPKKKKQPDFKVKKTFTNSLANLLIESDKKRRESTGRSRIRRLNRHEFESALSEILKVKLDIKSMLPEDSRKGGFDTVGEALNISTVQMEAYLKVIDHVLDEASFLTKEPTRQKFSLTYREDRYHMEQNREKQRFKVVPEGIVIFEPQLQTRSNPVLTHYTVPHKGLYNVTVSAAAHNSKKPVTMTVRLGGDGHFENDKVPRTVLGYVDTLPGKLQSFHFSENLVPGQFFRIYPSLLPQIEFSQRGRKGIGAVDRKQNYKGPGLLVSKITVDGPIYKQWPPESHKILWGDTPLKKLKNVPIWKDPNRHLKSAPKLIAKPKLTPKGKKFVYEEGQKYGGEPVHLEAKAPAPMPKSFELVPENPEASARQLITSFLPKAFRRKVSASEINEYFKLFQKWNSQGVSFEESMRTVYKFILTSPEFLYVKASSEKNSSSRISSLAMAERLAFFLWNSNPDQELLELADSGKIFEEKILDQQIERLLKDKRSDVFLENFLDQWLDLRLMDFTTPDSQLYPEFDVVLKWSMKEEVHAFFKEMIKYNLSVSNVVDSNFVMVNSRLAKHYELPPVKGMEIRKVSLPKDSPRGGVLGMAAIHKITANGTTTSPIVRGVWVLERIMGIHPPPAPSGVPGIEPDIRGATTILEQLEKHRNTPSCNGCHKLIDPPGVALESFDVIGGFRTNYRALISMKDKDNLKRQKVTHKLIKNGPPVVVKGELGEGKSFSDIHEFRKLLLQDLDGIARNVIEKLVIYSTGSEIGFADRLDLIKLVTQARKNNYGFKSIIKDLIKSRIFQRK